MEKPWCFGSICETCYEWCEGTTETCEFAEECFQESFKKPGFDDTGLDGCKVGKSIRKTEPDENG